MCIIIRSLLTAIEAHYRDPSNPYPGDDNAILFELTPYLESAGFHDPLSKVIDTGKCDVQEECRGFESHPRQLIFLWCISTIV